MATEKTIAMVTVTSFNTNEEIEPGVFGDIAETEYCDLRCRSTDQWHRRYPKPFDSDRRLVWRSAAGGTPAPDLVCRALDEFEATTRYRNPTYGWHLDELA